MLSVDNGEIKKDEGYGQGKSRRAFWRLSYDCYGPAYSRGVDGEGVDIIRQHEREDTGDHRRRVEVAVPICLVGPILRRYNDFVFRKPAETDEIFDDFYKNVDSLGTSSEEFMASALLDAQIEGASFIFVDSTSDGVAKTKVQADADGDRVIWVHVKADNVIHQRWHNGQLVETAFIQQDIDGQEFVLWYNREMVQRFNVDISGTSEGMIIKVTEQFEPEAHMHSMMPLVPVFPDFGCGMSQAASLAEMQKSVARLRTMLDEEIVNSTFTETFVTGESAANVSGMGLNVGSKYATFFPNPATAVTKMGGDPTQADSIRRSIDSDIKELYRTAGISADAGTDGPVESGIAKAFKFNDLAAILKSLSVSIEQAHRKCEKITADAEGIHEYIPVMYPDEFLMPIYEQELNAAILAVQSPLPQVLKAKTVKRFVNRNVELDKDDEARLDEQLENLGSLPQAFS